MAKKKAVAEGEPQDANDEERRVLPNIQARQVCIQEGFETRLKMERKIDDLIETHIKPVKDELKKLKKNMAADTDVEATDLNNLYRIFKRQEDAKTMEDGDDRDRILDNMRTTFNALQTGEMLDFIKVLDEAA